MQNVAFIINPNSSNKKYTPYIKLIETHFENSSYLISKSKEDTEQFIQNKINTVEIFIAIGGDGTISTVAKNLINTQKILGIFPAGSGNGFSNENNFTRNFLELVSKIKNKKYKLIDTFLVEDHFSINIAGVGFDSAVIESFEKTNRGFGNYIKTTIKTFFQYKPVQITFGEDYKHYNGEYFMINIANTRQFGNNAFIAPHANLDDGLLEIALVKKIPFFSAFGFVYRMFTQKLKPNRFLEYISVSEISLSVNTNNWHLDGEFTVINSPVKVKVLEKSLRILV